LVGQSWAQRAVTGKVTDGSGIALPNVTVLIKDTNIGTVTKEDGSYRLVLTADARTLVFHFAGMAPKEVVIGSQAVINITLSLTHNTSEKSANIWRPEIGIDGRYISYREKSGREPWGFTEMREVLEVLSNQSVEF
ncbi:MAG TPA: carboxypeptidase-like regulatory domain-containing protein, partial [Flavisolibacter sp.]|nr:carboxypeptidase-like regulatory domain-containing protein [Flavisolibacter sp.]